MPSAVPGADTEMLRYLRENNIAVDLETMNPVEMPKGEKAKMAAMFPYPTESVMAELSLGPQPKPSEYVAAMMVRRGRIGEAGYGTVRS